LIMIIDCHAHVVAPDSLYAFRSLLISSAGHFSPPLNIDDEVLAKAAASNVMLLDEVGTDVQLLSPRPFQQMHSAKPTRLVHRWIAANNDVIARICELHPTRLFGVAGLPLCAGEPVDSCFDELDRAINELGFVGVSLNPRSLRGQGIHPVAGRRVLVPVV
jgi:predicted TIM-barrel fold metal-dependent hydrolase